MSCEEEPPPFSFLTAADRMDQLQRKLVFIICMSFSRDSAHSLPLPVSDSYAITGWVMRHYRNPNMDPFYYIKENVNSLAGHSFPFPFLIQFFFNRSGLPQLLIQLLPLLEPLTQLLQIWFTLICVCVHMQEQVRGHLAEAASQSAMWGPGIQIRWSGLMARTLPAEPAYRPSFC